MSTEARLNAIPQPPELEQGPRWRLHAAAVLGLVFAIFCVAVHLKLTDRFDIGVEMAVHGYDGPVLDVLMRFLTTMGTHLVLAYVAIAGCILAWRQDDRKAAYWLLAVSGLTEAANVAVKTLFSRARPTLFEEVAPLATYSFPSGHAMTSTAVYGVATFVLARHWPGFKPVIYVATALFVGGIGLSRIYLGVHWPTDVLAGHAAGLAIVFLTVSHMPRRV